MFTPPLELWLDFLEAQTCGMLLKHTAPLNDILWQQLSVTMCMTVAGN
jgi:hypothetical protein